MAKRRPTKSESTPQGVWLTADEPGQMLQVARKKLSPRRLRLFAVACSRVMWGDRNRIPPYAEVLRLAEAMADGGEDPELAASLRLRAYPHGVIGLIDADAERAADIWAGMIGLKPKQRARLAHLLRDIAGNPFEKITLDPALPIWRDGTIFHLAQAIYDESAYERIGVLGDALEEAGCSDPLVLDHVRNELPHCRGCWVVDWILGKK